MSKIIKLSGNLADYMPESGVKWNDTNHIFFIDMYTPEELHAELKRLSEVIIPSLLVMIKSHIDRLYIPAPAEKLTNDIIPIELARTLAYAIDTYCPLWNIAQKTNLYANYMPPLASAAHRDYMQRVKDKAAAEARADLEARAEAIAPANKRVPGSEDSGEVDINTDQFKNSIFN